MLSVGMGGVVPQKLRATDVAQVVDAYGGTQDDMDRCLRLESEVFPLLMEHWNDKKSGVQP